MENLPELKNPIQCALHFHEIEARWIERFSSLARMLRVVGYCLRFIHYVRKCYKSSGPISHTEQKQALLRIVKCDSDDTLYIIIYFNV